MIIGAAAHENGETKELMVVMLQRKVNIVFAILESWYTLLALNKKSNVVHQIEIVNSQDASRKEASQSRFFNFEGSTGTDNHWEATGID